MALQRERVPAGAAALLAVLLTVPSVLAPTWHLTTLDSQRGVVLFDQQFWSWGRSQVLGAGGVVVQDLWDPLGLVVLVTLLLLAAGAAVAWLLLRAAWVPVVAPLAWAALLGHLVTSSAQRHGRPVRDDVHGLAASGASTVVGWLESTAALVGVVAVALVVLSLTGVRMPSAWVARVRALGRPDDADGPVRVAAPGARSGARAAASASWRSVDLPVAAPREAAEEQSVPEPGAEQPAPGPVADGAVSDGAVGGREALLVRRAGATLGAVGVLLAATTAVWPTTVVAVRAPEVGDFTKGYEQRIWSWGRQVVYSSDGVLLDAYGGPNPVARLVLLVAVLACAAAGLAWWLRRPGRLGELTAAAGLALALATVGGSLVERLSFDERSIGLQPGLVRWTTPTGRLEVAAVVVLALALVLVAATVLPGPAGALAGRLSAASTRLAGPRRSRSSAGVLTPGPSGVTERPTTQRAARLRDATPTGTTRTTSVGFSDDDDEGRGRG
ncbi:hypothetical protein GCM10009817_35980 [Terrabacter lapilli]|uniref:Uncharacterized protein n=1 Tax=Terrabacter lapilli TaxID=436231 RepID=A0ABP5E371_9MICO